MRPRVPGRHWGSGLTWDSDLQRFHVRRADGQLVYRMRGFPALWRVLPRTAWLARLASLGPMPALLDIAYSVFPAIRPLWQKAPAADARGQPS